MMGGERRVLYGDPAPIHTYIIYYCCCSTDDGLDTINGQGYTRIVYITWYCHPVQPPKREKPAGNRFH